MARPKRLFTKQDAEQAALERETFKDLCHCNLRPECVLQVIHRLWHGLYPIQTINSIRVDQYNLSDTAAWLAKTFSALQPSPMTPFYQHSYGYSRSL